MVRKFGASWEWLNRKYTGKHCRGAQHVLHEEPHHPIRRPYARGGYRCVRALVVRGRMVHEHRAWPHCDGRLNSLTCRVRRYGTLKWSFGAGIPRESERCPRMRRRTSTETKCGPCRYAHVLTWKSGVLHPVVHDSSTHRARPTSHPSQERDLHLLTVLWPPSPQMCLTHTNTGMLYAFSMMPTLLMTSC